jgi:lysophospholipase L1-like esterase
MTMRSKLTALAIAGLAALLAPSAHAGVVVALGDSITASGYPAVLADELGGSWTVLNKGVPGNGTPQMIDRFASDVTPAGPRVVVILAGINDQPLYDGNPAGVEEGLTTLYRDALAIGAVPVPVTILPDGRGVYWTPTMEAARLQVNAWIRDQPYPYVDAEGEMVQPGTADLLPAYDPGDGTHPNADGVRALAGVVYAQAFASGRVAAFTPPPAPAPTPAPAPVAPASSPPPAAAPAPPLATSTPGPTAATPPAAADTVSPLGPLGVDGPAPAPVRVTATAATTTPQSSKHRAYCALHARATHPVRGCLRAPHPPLTKKRPPPKERPHPAAQQSRAIRR